MNILDTAQSQPGHRLRPDLELIAGLIDRNSRVLDIGCGDGALLHHLVNEKDVDGRGIEIGHAGVHACVSQGLSVIQGDANTDLAAYPDSAFDFVVLSDTLQATHAPRDVLTQLVRIGQRAVVSFANFGHWRVRWQFLTQGRMPMTERLPHHWYDTPNIHLCTIRDFFELCTVLGLQIERSVSFGPTGTVRELNSAGFFTNLRGERALFLLSRS